MSIRLFVLLFVNLCSFAVDGQAQRIAVISDVHLLAPELLQPGIASEKLMASETKMVQASDAIMAYATDTLLRLHPDLVLICGDLTYNGERASHLRLLRHLQRLRQAGTVVCVIPGNHDIRNPNARAFLHEGTEDTATISATDFANLYDIGQTATSHFLRDTLSLSYSITPLPGLTILGIDSNRYAENLLLRNGDERNVYLSAGRILPQTLTWICDRANEARADGRRIIALMHHHLVEHFDGESMLLPNYIIPDADSTAIALAAAGVHVIFTGHLHITDAATATSASADNSDLAITDVSTGSLTTYPFPLRLATIDADGQLTIQTRFLHPSDSLVEAGRKQLENGINTLANMLADRIWKRYGKRLTEALSMLALFGDETAPLPTDSRQLADLLTRKMHPILLRCLLTVTQGNEPETDANLIPALQQAATTFLTAILPSVEEDTALEIVQNLWPRIQPLLTSIFQDMNRVSTQTESRTDDHTLVIKL